MKIPIWIYTVIGILTIFGIIGLYLRIFTECRVIGDIADFALIGTLIALILYVHYTYLLAKEAWTVSASFGLIPIQGDPYHFVFFIKNHSKHSLRCWCRLNPTIYRKVVDLDNFYGGKSSCDIQPYGDPCGHFDIQDILAKANLTIKEMKQKAISAKPKEQLHLDIEFWYTPVGAKNETHNPRQPHYFDFNRDKLVADF